MRLPAPTESVYMQERSNSKSSMWGAKEVGSERGLRPVGWYAEKTSAPLLLALHYNAALFAAGWKSTVHWYTWKSRVTL